MKKVLSLMLTLMLLSVYGNVDGCAIGTVCSNGQTVVCSGNKSCEGDANSVTCTNHDGTATKGICDSGGGKGSGSGSGAIASIDPTP